MGKVSIALRGWRFEEDDVFAPDGRLKPFEEMPEDAARRLSRLSSLVGSPCDACWLIHGDQNLEDCRLADVVYGEPLAEVVLCSAHEDDFVYWFREAGGSSHRGEPAFQDVFHEWFAEGGRAPAGYEGVEHVDTDPQALPDLPDDRSGALDMHLPDEERERIDLAAMEVHQGGEADRNSDRENVDEDEGDGAGEDGVDGGEDDDDVEDGRDVEEERNDEDGRNDEGGDGGREETEAVDLEDADVDLSRDYPG